MSLQAVDCVLPFNSGVFAFCPEHVGCEPEPAIADPASGGTIAEALLAQTRMTWPRESSLIARYLPLVPGARVADICCGIGDFAARLYDRFSGLDITGIDWSASGVALARARRGARAIDYRVADATRLPLPDDSFDVVTCRHALQVMPQPVRDAVIAERSRICKPGGTIYVSNENIGCCSGTPEMPRITRAYRRLVELMTESDMDIDCGPAQAAWLREAGLVEIETLPWLVTNEADPLGFAALVDSWDPVFRAILQDLRVDFGEQRRMLAGLAAHRRAALTGSASWPIWSSFARKPGGRSS